MSVNTRCIPNLCFDQVVRCPKRKLGFRTPKRPQLSERKSVRTKHVSQHTLHSPTSASIRLVRCPKAKAWLRTPKRPQLSSGKAFERSMLVNTRCIHQPLLRSGWCAAQSEAWLSHSKRPQLSERKSVRNEACCSTHAFTNLCFDQVGALPKAKAWLSHSKEAPAFGAEKRSNEAVGHTRCIHQPLLRSGWCAAQSESLAFALQKVPAWKPG